MSQLRFGYVFFDHVPPISSSLSNMLKVACLNFDFSWIPAQIPAEGKQKRPLVKVMPWTCVPERPAPMIITSKGIAEESIVRNSDFIFRLELLVVVIS